MRLLSTGPNSLLIEQDSLEATMALYECLHANKPTGLHELVPAARTILLGFDGRLDPLQLFELIDSCRLAKRNDKDAKLIEIEALYDGPDLELAARHLKLSVKELIKVHSSSEYEVAFLGFAPGFAYMISKDNDFNLPRLESPRLKVPKGSVSLAGDFCGIYPKESPGGWQIIANTRANLWDTSKEQPALLLPGNRVRFKPIEKEQLEVTSPKDEPSKRIQVLPKGASPSMLIISPGLLASFQGAGESLFMYGISRAGALDKGALRSANAMVGNKWDEPCIEISMGGFKALALSPMLLAISGAKAAIHIRKKNGKSYVQNTYEPFLLEATDQISIEVPKAGVRNYLALRGGFLVQEELGSSSYNSLCQLGPAPLKKDDFLYPANKKAQAISNEQSPANPFITSKDEISLDIFMGPRTEYFTQEALKTLCSTAYELSSNSDRIGMRLNADVFLERKIKSELLSEGIVSGAIQVPANGLPIIFMADHPLTGGYPVIAHLAPSSINKAAQIPVGAKIRFKSLGEKIYDLT